MDENEQQDMVQEEDHNVASSASSSQYYYIDSNSVLQGPFPFSSMHTWTAAGYFEKDTLIADSVQDTQTPPSRSIFQPLSSIPTLHSLLSPPPPSSSSASVSNPAAAVSADVDAKEEQFYYKDDEEKIQGPYSLDSLRQWYSAGYFTAHTLIRCASEHDYASIEQRREKGKQTWKLEETRAGEQQDNMSESSEDAGIESQSDPESAAPADSSSLGWYYTSSDGIEHGPYSNAQFYYWYRAGWLTHDSSLCIRREDERKPGIPISKRSIMPSFLSQPVLQAMAANLASEQSMREERWYYLDNSDAELGPFTNEEMRAWYHAGHFPPTLRVRRVGEHEALYTPVHARNCAFTKVQTYAHPTGMHGTLLPLYAHHAVQFPAGWQGGSRQ